MQTVSGEFEARHKYQTNPPSRATLQLCHAGSQLQGCVINAASARAINTWVEERTAESARSSVSRSAGSRQCWLWFFSGLFCGVFDCSENDSGGLLDHFQAFSEQRGIAVVQVDVISRCPAGLKSDGLSDHKSDGLGLGFA